MLHLRDRAKGLDTADPLPLSHLRALDSRVRGASTIKLVESARYRRWTTFEDVSSAVWRINRQASAPKRVVFGGKYGNRLGLDRRTPQVLAISLLPSVPV